ncbi:MAG: hypothetical protein FWF03_03605 [Defluviitaleaceae bacterium]|nr:hypothetical protein [Defluviitaleaceae bacterium]
MTHAAYEKIAEAYNRVFADWLYIHYIPRTLLLLCLALTLAYIAVNAVRYVAAPFAAVVYFHMLLRLWNFFVTETAQEWLYVKYFSKGRQRFVRTYQKKCDSVKKNRKRMTNASYFKIIRRTGYINAFRGLLVSALLVAGLMNVSVGLFVGYRESVEKIEAASRKQPDPSPTIAPTPAPTEAPEPEELSAPDETETELEIDPRRWGDGAELYFMLNEHGTDGANIRDLPSFRFGEIVDMVWGDMLLVYLNEFSRDVDNDDLFWLKVRIPSGTEGFISSLLLTEVALDE